MHLNMMDMMEITFKESISNRNMMDMMLIIFKLSILNINMMHIKYRFDVYNAHYI